MVIRIFRNVIESEPFSLQYPYPLHLILGGSHGAARRESLKRDIRSVLVIYKKSDYHLYIEEKGDPCLSKWASEQKQNIDEFFRNHQENLAALEKVRQVLAKHEIHSDWFYRESFDSLIDYDMVLSVGGDGTLLEAARKITDQTPLLGVNSSPSSSVGYLCGTNAEHFEETFSDFLRGELPENHLSRIEAICNGKLLAPPALNDVLYADESPAATSKYLITSDGFQEQHRSSGLWVSTATGSTAAIRSAGGVVMPFELIKYSIRCT